MISCISAALQTQGDEGCHIFADQRVAQLPEDLLKFVAPHAKTLDEYAIAIRSALGGKRFGVIIDGVLFSIIKIKC